MSDTLQKGWLTTRDGQKYAPATLVENVYTRSGKPYDERVREYIQGLKSTQTTDIAALWATVNTQGGEIDALQDKTAYFNGDASDKLFIVDNAENVIAYIDGAGVHSVDFDIPNSISLSGAKQSIDQLKADLATLGSETDTRLQNFSGNEDGNTLFIIDSQENVIAYIDADGIHTTKVSVTEGISDESSEAIFFIDQNENAVAYINNIGVHSIDFLIDDENGATVYALKSVIDGLIAADGEIKASQVALETRIGTEENARKSGDEALQERAAALELKTQNLDSSEDTDGFYIIDNSADKNVVAYVNGTGIHAIDVYVDDYDADGNKQVASLRDVENRTEGLENWQIGAQTALDNYGLRISMQENVTGETTTPAKTHKKRLDDLETYVGSSGSSGTSLNDRLTTIETLVGTVDDESTVNTHEGRIKANLNSIIALQDKVENVSNVMDFIGTFAKLSDLYTYENPNKGDVAVVTDLATEYVYNGTTWVELGNSTATSTAITNLQSVVGHTGGLNANETSHHAQLVDHEGRISGLEGEFVAHTTEAGTKFSNLEATVNYIGSYVADPATAALGDLAMVNGTLKRYTGSAWETYEGLSKKLYYLDGTESGVFYFTDSADNVVAFVDDAGLTTIDVVLKTLKYEGGQWSVIESGNVGSVANISVAEKLAEIMNDIAALKALDSTLPTVYKKLQNSVDSGTVATNSFVSRITQDSNGKITVTKDSVDFSAYLSKTDAASTYKPLQTAVSDPAASGTSTSFIASISQDKNGKITVTKKNLASYQPAGNYKTTQSAVNSPSTSGSTLEFIDTISQNTNGVITATKKSVDFTSINTSIANLQTWQDNWDAKASVDIEDKIYFIDSKDNVIAYFDNDGLTVTNINLRTPVVPSGSTPNATGQSTSTMIFFQSKGTITVNDSFL